MLYLGVVLKMSKVFQFSSFWNSNNRSTSFNNDVESLIQTDSEMNTTGDKWYSFMIPTSLQQRNNVNEKPSKTDYFLSFFPTLVCYS